MWGIKKLQKKIDEEFNKVYERIIYCFDKNYYAPCKICGGLFLKEKMRAEATVYENKYWPHNNLYKIVYTCIHCDRTGMQKKSETVAIKKKNYEKI